MSDWIPVHQRLPDYGQEVLLYRPDAAKSHDPVFTLRERVRGYRGPYEFQCIAVPTHWMALPEPPTATAGKDVR